MTGRSTALAALGLLVLTPWAGALSPTRPATVGPAHVNDALVLSRLGLALDTEPAPHTVATPDLARMVADDAPGIGYGTGPFRMMMLPGGDALVLGKYGWIYRGAGLGTLRPVRFQPELSGERTGLVGWRFAADGRSVAYSDATARLVGLDAALNTAWPAAPAPLEAPHADPPFALSGDRVFAVGGTPAILGVGDGGTVAAIAPVDAGSAYAAVAAAPDGTARAVVDRGGFDLQHLDVTGIDLRAIAADGTAAWQVRIADAPQGLALAATPVSVGADGTAYVGWGLTNHTSIWDGRVTATSADGRVRWTARVGGGPSRPAVDGRGNVWVITGQGDVVAITPDGEVAFRRHLWPRSSTGAVYADGDGVLAAGPITVRLAARPAGRGGTEAMTVRRTLPLLQPPVRCVAPPTGAPRTCLYRIARTPSLRVTSPADGLATVRIAPATPILVADASGRKRPLRPAPDVVPVLAGVNVMPLGVLNRALTVCRTGLPCTVAPGAYRVTVVPPGGRAVTRTVVVTRGAGRHIDY